MNTLAYLVGASIGMIAVMLALFDGAILSLLTPLAYRDSEDYEIDISEDLDVSTPFDHQEHLTWTHEQAIIRFNLWADRDLWQELVNKPGNTPEHTRQFYNYCLWVLGSDLAPKPWDQPIGLTPQEISFIQDFFPDSPAT